MATTSAAVPTTANHGSPPLTPGPALGTPSAAAPSSSATQGVVLTQATASSLYLYTFLATLVLLLGVSGAVIIRSLLLRRRHRRMVEEAIRNGTYVAPAERRRFGEGPPQKKPEMYDSYLQDDDELEKWGGLMPVAAALVRPAEEPASPTTAPVTATAEWRSGSFLSPYLPIRHARQAPAPAATAPSASSAPQADDRAPFPAAAAAEPPAVRIAVMIAMPSEARSAARDDRRSGRGSSMSSGSGSRLGKEKASESRVDVHSASSALEEEPELPHIEFGIAEVPIVVRRGDSPPGV